MKKYKAALTDFSGGLNDSFDPSAIGAAYSSKLENLYLRGPHIYRRNGIPKYAGGFAERVTGLFAYGKEVGNWLLIAGLQSGLSSVVAGAPVALSNLDSVSIPSSDDPWRMRQYKNVGYTVRAGVLGLLRFTDTGFSLAGIDKPATAPTIAAVAGGTMEAGARHVVMTFVNLDTDVESNPSSDSNSATLVANDRISVTNAAVSSNPQVTGRRFYVELADIPGQYYLALETTDLTSTSFILDKQIKDLGALASFRNARPAQVEYIDLEVWKERLWLATGVDLLYSENIAGVGLAECFAAANFIPIFPDDR
ncbi:MAG TPA: hypothetical protein VGQ24_00660, partial [Gemmatimonadales bacterium]|nr:hypothetical protein [Gemmatimonadales bacterium]